MININQKLNELYLDENGEIKDNGHYSRPAL
jgi:hypothetical protein